MKRLLLILILITTGLHGQVTGDKDLSHVNAMIRDGKFEAAEKLLQEIDQRPANKTGPGYAFLLNSWGSLNMNKGRNDLALENLEQAQAIWEQNNMSKSLEAAETQMLLGNLYRVTGKYAQAEDQLNMALINRKNKFPETHESVAAVYNDFGLIYALSDPDKALTFYEKALVIYETLHGKDDPKIAVAKSNTGLLYTRIELYGDAINNFESALAIWNNIYPGAHPSKAFVLYNLGQTYQLMDNHTNARTYYERAEKMYVEVYGERHPDIARVNNSLGNLEIANNHFAAGLTCFQKALRANHADFNNPDLTTNPAVARAYDGNVLLFSLLFKAEALEKQYFGKTLRFKDLLLAIRTLETCDTLISKLRQHISNESDKISLGAVADDVYAYGVRISMEAAATAVHKKGFREKAFYFSEKSKAAVLLGAISESNAKTFAGIPPHMLEQEKQIKAAIVLCVQQLAQKPDGATEKELRENFYALNRNYESFTASLEKEYPAYFNLKYNSASPSIAELQKLLNGHTLVISYFIDDKFNRLYIFEVTASGFAVEDHELAPDFERNIKGFRNSLLFSEINTFRKSSYYLSKSLLPARIKSNITSLVIIPAGRISTIPFEALLTSDGEKANGFDELPYLVNKYAVRYQFATQLMVSSGAKNKISKQAVLLCAPVSFNDRQGMPDLPGTESEIREIKNLFDQKQLPSLVMLQQDADEQRLKSEDLKQYGYLHFATHGIVDETSPELSRIFLQTRSASEDGYLYAGEIYNLELDADLVTLSACETGLGKISKGEGVIGLSRALVYAGAKNCIVSFWKVSDESTALLMTSYYRSLLNQGAFDLRSTLQKVKLEMIRGRKFASPYFWAPFILIGN
jgi:CHAT domain-containing protein/tetratricopeptide (TPR) repeat protein